MSMSVAVPCDVGVGGYGVEGRVLGVEVVDSIGECLVQLLWGAGNDWGVEWGVL